MDFKKFKRKEKPEKLPKVKTFSQKKPIELYLLERLFCWQRQVLELFVRTVS